MVENTAGIGVAESLINKATPPTDLGLMRGLQMAENSALKKAQLEAQKAAKLAAQEEKVSRFMIGEPKYENKSVQKKAHDISNKYTAAMLDSIDDRPQREVLKMKWRQELNDLDNEDTLLTRLGSGKANEGLVDTSDAKRAYESGQFEDWLTKQHPLVQRNFHATEGGGIDVMRPKKMNFDAEYNKYLLNLPKEYTDINKAAFGQLKITSKVPDSVMETAAHSMVVNNQEYNHALDWNKDFQKYFDKYAETHKQEKDPERLEVLAKTDYTLEKLQERNYNKTALKGMPTPPSGVKRTFATTGGVLWGGNQVPVIDESVEELRNSLGSAATGSEEVNKVLSGLPAGSEVKKIPLTDLGLLTIKLKDKSVENANVVNIYDINGVKFIEYTSKVPFMDIEQRHFSELTPEAFTVINGKYKADMNEVKDAFSEQGIDFSPYVKKIVNINRAGAKQKEQSNKAGKKELKGIPKGGFN